MTDLVFLTAIALFFMFALGYLSICSLLRNAEREK